MLRIVADVNQEWEILSDEHERLNNTISNILDSYRDGTLQHHSYAIIGVFGSGKTQLMIHIFKKALEKGLLPIYLLAEDIFKDFEGTPAELNEYVSQLVEVIAKNIRDGNFEKVIELTNAQRGLKFNLVQLLKDNIVKIKESIEEYNKTNKNNFETPLAYFHTSIDYYDKYIFNPMDEAINRLIT